MKEKLQFYLSTTYRRKSLDEFQEKYKNCYSGIVLDIGGKDRGKFVKPRKKVEKWIFADIEKSYNPDIVLDISNMEKIKDNSIDVINAMELFEHVEYPERGLMECYRVLKEDGCMLISVPFLFPIHGDPFDFQRWTEEKWKKVLNETGFEIVKFEKMGLFFSILSDMLKLIVKSLPVIKYFLFIYPVLDLISKLDKTNYTQKNIPYKDYVQGYFIITKKLKI